MKFKQGITMSECKVISMLLKKNYPLPKEPEWKSTICFECGQECWYIPRKEPISGVLKLACTECLD